MEENEEEARDTDHYLSLLKGDAPSPSVSFLLHRFLSVSSNYDQNHADFPTFCLLKKAFIIYSIRQATAHGSLLFPDYVLDSLVTIEQLDRRQGLPVPDYMPSAFCAIAVHCTLSALRLSWPCYFDAVQRIWRSLIPNLEDSGSTLVLAPDLPKWRDDIEAAIWDTDASQRLLRINTHDEALRRIRVFLREAHFSMKPAFLQSALASTSQLPSAHPSADKAKRFLSVNSQRRCKFRSSHRCNKRSVIVAASQKNPPSPSNNGSPSTANVDNLLQYALKSSTSNLIAGAANPLSETFEVAGKDASVRTVENLPAEATVEDYNKDKGVPATSVIPTTDVPATFVNPTEEPAQAERMEPDMAEEILHDKTIGEGQSKMDTSALAPSVSRTAESVQANQGIEGNQALIQQDKVDRPNLTERNSTADKGKGILMVNSQTRCMLGSSHRRHRGRVIIADSDQPSCSKYDSLSTPEVNKLRDALKSSTADLLKAVTDPLPEALEVAERVTKSFNPTADVPATSVNPTMESAQAERVIFDEAGKNLHDKSIEEENSEDNSAVPPFVDPPLKPAQAKEGNQPNQASLHQNKVYKRSLMERNETACTHQWEDSIDDSVEGKSSCSKRCHLPSPDIKHVSPLKEDVPRKWVRKRKINRWTVEEEEALMQATDVYGSSSWARILAAYPETFRNRTTVDLKDKWRNLVGRRK